MKNTTKIGKDKPDDVFYYIKNSVTLAYKYYNRRPGQETIVLFYGFDGSISMMDVFAPHLSEYNVLVIDYPGHGYSPALEGSVKFDLEQFTELAAGLLKSLGQTEYHIIGYSFGGPTAIDLYMKNKEKVKKILLLNSCTNFSYNILKKYSYKLFHRLVKSNFEFIIPKIAIPFLADGYFTPELLQKSQEVSLYNDHESVLQLFQQTIHEDFDHMLDSIECPLLFIGGGKDLLVEARIVKKLAKKRDNFECIINKKLGHISIASKPEILAQQIQSFFKE